MIILAKSILNFNNEMLFGLPVPPSANSYLTTLLLPVDHSLLGNLMGRADAANGKFAEGDIIKTPHLCTMTETEQIIALGKKVVALEAGTLHDLTQSLDAAFAQAVLAMLTCTGRIIVTGVGKSALIGQKIVATLNSTGTSAHFMHGADALHGDLGMLQAADIILVLSKSGETEELKALLPAISRIGARLIAITAYPSSTLGALAEIILHTPLQTEADPHNLAPTASTIAQLALGDALAITLMQLRGFTPTDFARNHPGGSLGKQLTLTIADLAKQHSKPAVHSQESIKQVIHEISRGRLGAVAVIDVQQQVLGIITDGDIRRMLEHHTILSDLTAESLMHLNPKTVQSDTLAVQALAIMQEHSISQVIVLDAQTRKYAGMVHFHDILREGLA
jgi:arabinose-5-phosphate isomerase